MTSTTKAAADDTGGAETEANHPRTHSLGLVGRAGSTKQQAETEQNSKYIRLQSILDSGAARSVCPVAFAQHIPIEPSKGSINGDCFRTATGDRVVNQGTRAVAGHTRQGRIVMMNYSVADVTVALDSISQMCDAGAEVIFRKDGGVIRAATGQETPFRSVNDTYVRDVWVEKPGTGGSAPFRGQRPRAS